MDRKRRRDPLLGRKQASQVPVYLAHEVVCTRRVDAITVRRRWLRADKVIALLDGEDKEGVALVNTGGGESVKEFAKRLVVVFQLLHIVSRAGTAGDVDFTGDTVLVVPVRDISKRHRDALLLHLRDVGEGCSREQPVKARLVEL